MEKIVFETDSGRKLHGYRCDYADIKLGVSNDKCLSVNYWTVFELSTGLRINTTGNKPTRKRAIQTTIDFIKTKGLITVRQQIQIRRLDKHLGGGINQSLTT